MNPSPLPTGHGSAQVLTPAAIGTAVRVGKTRKYRKLLLPRKQIKANGRSLDLASYFSPLVNAEREHAFPFIPLQVHETHTKDPRYTEGTVSNLVHLPDGPDGDGLYGDVEFSDDSGVAMVEKSKGQVGVSVSMVENLVREEDGKRHAWPAALQHVLMTTDPHVRQTGGGWHPIELGRADVTETVDLSGSTYEQIEEEPMTAPTTAPPEGQTAPAEGAPNEAGLVSLEVTPEQRDRLLGLLSDIETAENVAGRGSGDNQGAPAEGASPDASNAGASAANLERDDASSNAIELIRGEVEVERSARIELERQLDAERARTEIVELSRTGLAPAIIEAARPLLEAPRGSGVIELARADGGTDNVDPGAVVRNVLNQVVELSRRGLGAIDLDQEVGMHVGGEAEQAERAAKLAALDAAYPVN
jgi:hypothetical protein